MTASDTLDCSDTECHFVMFSYMKFFPVLKDRNIIGKLGRKLCTHITEPGLFSEVSPSTEDSGNKVTVVGAGRTGVACAFAILSQGIADSVVMVDKNKDKLFGETLDMQHGSLFLKTNKIKGLTCYSETANSKISIITAGVCRTSDKQSRFSLAKENNEIFKEIIPELIKYSPNTIMIIVTNPVDIMTWVAWKLSRFPLSRVIGCGTGIDTARFRYLISRRFGIPANNCHAYVIGEHDRNLIASWSVVNIGGVRLRELNPQAALEGDKEGWNEVKQQLIEGGHEILRLKGYTSWGVALSIARIVENILRNSNKIRTVSTNVKGCHGVDFEVFLSLPCVLNANGIHRIVKQPLRDDEKKKFMETAKVHKKHMDSLNIY